jgi:undecaprenyl diphosphate synthase
VCIAFNYGGRAEILDAARRLMTNGMSPDGVDEGVFSSYLYTADIPDPDLIIRTAGEMRLSNFLLWQGAYAEFYCTDVYWPAFGSEDIDRALLAFSQRKRRFGGLLPEDEDPPSYERSSSKDSRKG